MFNVLKGEVPLKTTDGRRLVLIFDMEAMIEAEGVYGKPMHIITHEASLGFMGAMRALFFGATRAKHPEFTLSDVAALLDTDAERIGDALTAAADAAMPEAAASAGGKVPRRSPRGVTSGGSGATSASIRKRSGG